MKLKTTPETIGSWQDAVEASFAAHYGNAAFVDIPNTTLSALIADAREAHRLHAALAALVRELRSDADDFLSQGDRHLANDMRDMAEHLEAVILQVSAAENLKKENGVRGTNPATPPPEYTVVRHCDYWKIKGPMFSGTLDEPIFLAEYDADTICAALNRLAAAEEELAAFRARDFNQPEPLGEWLAKHVPGCEGAKTVAEALERLAAKPDQASLAHKYAVLAARGVEETKL